MHPCSCTHHHLARLNLRSLLYSCPHHWHVIITPIVGVRVYLRSHFKPDIGRKSSHPNCWLVAVNWLIITVQLSPLSGVCAPLFTLAVHVIITPIVGMHVYLCSHFKQDIDRKSGHPNCWSVAVNRLIITVQLSPLSAVCAPLFTLAVHNDEYVISLFPRNYLAKK